MFRFILIVIFLLFYLVLGIPVLGVEWIIGKFNKKAKDYSCLRMVQWGFSVILWLTGVNATIIGEENVPDEPVLYIVNHRSYLDILLTYVRCQRLTGYIAKKEMLKFYLLRDWMKQLYCLFLDRDDMRQGLQIILTAIDYIKSGISICIFPEGTRNLAGEEGTLLPFHEGSFKIAEKTGCAIVPISITNSISIFEKQMPKIRKSHVIVEYGKPIYPETLSKEDRKKLGSYTAAIIQETVRKNMELV
ncbi:MAG: 1-acyl-sn-glycerol-3-phosphate acyltransferase [Lachnospiraceae bacterium]|jgi:1-acyl-sn-glycerol-3-phosphate acyltransferase|nr:1-acyl-sn-glycerol-3-phosphate acyltransferase [Lachnospiraceae bacterium]